MSDTHCAYRGDRDDVLIAYLYDDITPIDRASFDAHLSTCRPCRAELDALRGVRARLTRWAPPQPSVVVDGPEAAVEGRSSTVESHRRWWREIPAWAQVAAAMLVLGVSAGLANLNVHYGDDGLTVRTGWSSVGRDSSRAGSPTSAGRDLTLDTTPWRADLTALAQQLRTELRPSGAGIRPVAVHTASMSDDEIIRRVRALIAESERRQQSELALRIAGVVNEVSAGRAADLARIRQTLGALETSTGAELFKQRQTMVNYLNQVSLKR